jgi:multidrug efflux pump subunit AcrA (membrane-fusion protein)
MIGSEQNRSPPAAEPTDAQAVAYLDNALWSQLHEGAELAVYASAWLALQCQNIAGVFRAVLVLRAEHHEHMEPVAYWPKGRGATLGLSAAAEAALAEGRGVARARKPKPGEPGAVPDSCDVAYPIALDDEIIGVVALEIEPRPKEALAAVIRQLQWGAVWISSFFVRRMAGHDRAARGRLQLAIELFAATFERGRFHDAATAFATELATELDCERVTVGWRRRGACRVIAMSHSAHFDRRMKLLAAIGRAMDEAADQWSALVHPPSDDQEAVLHAHDELAALNGGNAILTTPMLIGDRAIGAVALERAATRPFGADELELVAALAALAAPTLEEKRRNDRGLIVKALSALGLQLGRLLGPAHLGRKLALALLAALAGFMTIAKGDYRVTADARLEGVVQRAIAAPFEGFIAEANVRAGDTVQAGQTLARLDARDLEIERLQWLSDRHRSLLEYDKALSAADRASLNITRAQVVQAEAQIALRDTQIARTVLSAPFDGIVVSGDLSQRIGDAVTRGELLFEIAPLDDYRVNLRVDEREIADVALGQHGQLALSAMPERALPLTVVRITPVSEQVEGRNVFIVEARIDGASGLARLRPGMEGVAKVAVDRRRLIWIWTYKIVDWTRLAIWRWWP